MKNLQKRKLLMEKQLQGITIPASPSRDKEAELAGIMRQLQKLDKNSARDAATAKELEKKLNKIVEEDADYKYSLDLLDRSRKLISNVKDMSQEQLAEEVVEIRVLASRRNVEFLFEIPLLDSANQSLVDNSIVQDFRNGIWPPDPANVRAFIASRLKDWQKRIVSAQEEFHQLQDRFDALGQEYQDIFQKHKIDFTSHRYGPQSRIVPQAS